MLSILEGFAYGQALRAVSSNEEKLLRILEGEEKVLFQKYVEAQGELNQLTAVGKLIYGYKLGLMMTAEAFLTSDSLVAGEDD